MSFLSADETEEQYERSIEANRFRLQFERLQSAIRFSVPELKAPDYETCEGRNLVEVIAERLLDHDADPEGPMAYRNSEQLEGTQSRRQLPLRTLWTALTDA